MDGSVKLPLIDALTFRPRADFDYKRRPVILLDGEVHYVKDLRAELTGNSAFIIGTNQQSFEQVCRFLNIQKACFYEMRVPDLSALAQIRGLTDLAIIWNTKATSIEVLTDLAPLSALVLEDTPKITDLSPLASHTSLKAFGFRGNLGSMCSKNTAQTLAPLAELKSLVELSLLNLRVIEGGLRPIAHCQALQVLDVSNQFDTADYAFLKANLPNASCSLFAPYLDCQIKNMDRTIKFDTAITGRRKPYLLRKSDEQRITKYERQFEKLYKEALAALNH